MVACARANWCPPATNASNKIMTVKRSRLRIAPAPGDLSVWREGKCIPLAVILEERASGDETPRAVCGSLLDVSREGCLRRRCFFRAPPGRTGNAACDGRIPRDERRETFRRRFTLNCQGVL